MAKILASLLLFLFPVVLAAAPECITDPELMAEVAARHLLEQEYLAVRCAFFYQEKLEKKPGELLTLTRDVSAKFDLQLSRYRELREQRFRRLFGEQWRLALRGDRSLKLWELRHKVRQLGERECIGQKSQWETDFKQTWEALRSQLESRMAALRSRVPLCPIETRGLFPPWQDPFSGQQDTRMPPLPGVPPGLPSSIREQGGKGTLPPRALPGFPGVMSPH